MTEGARTGRRADERGQVGPRWDLDEEGHTVDAATRRRDRRILVSIMLGLALALGGLYVAAYVFAGDHLPRSTTVAGVDVGGMRPDQARRTVARELRKPMARPVTVDAGGYRARLDPERVGLDVDVAASVAQAPVGRSWDPADMWESVVGGGDYDAVVVLVDDLLRNRLRKVAREVAQPAVDGTVQFTPRGPRAVYPRDGQRLDVRGAVRAVRAAYPSDGSVVTLPVASTQPVVDATAVNRAMRTFANPAMAEPVTYRIGFRQVVLRPAEFARALSMQARRGKLVPQVDADRLMQVFHRAAVADGRKDVSVSSDEVAGTFLDLVTSEGRDRTLTLPATG